MKIQVLSQDIKNGHVASQWSCPISLALRRATKANLVATGLFSVVIAGQSVSLPLSAIQFRKKFDRREKVYPFTFELPYEVKK